VFVRPNGEELDELARLYDEGRLVVELQEVLPLEEAARAHEVSEAGHVRGKLVLTL
jgi:NADPH:quinone reductase-like Zn-dependent oxidoreductase